MDLLSQRYASPFTVLEGMLRAGSFYEFVVEVNSIAFEEKEESRLWDIWLHKVFQQDWDEWRNSIRTRAEMQSVTESDLEATVLYSQELLNNFNLEKTE